MRLLDRIGIKTEGKNSKDILKQIKRRIEEREDREEGDATSSDSSSDGDKSLFDSTLITK